MPDSSPVKRTPKGRARAKAVIGFIERLTIPSGTGQGKPFRLEPFQKNFIRDIYEPHLGLRRAVRRAILSMARKNGKTALIAAIVLAHLVGPEAVVHGEIYSAANDRDQAAIVYKFARQMVELEPELLNEIELVPSTKTMVARRTGSVYRAISAEAGTKHGYLPSVVIYDELAQAKNRDLYDVLDTSFGARQEPLFIAISTQSNDPEHILSKLIDDGLSGIDPSIVCHLFAADDECDLGDEPQWHKANPALGKFRDYEDLATAIRKAIRMPAEEPKVRNLFLNQRIAPIASLISRQEWMACVGQDVARQRRGGLPGARSIERGRPDRAAGRLGRRSVSRGAALLEAARASERTFEPRFRLGLASLPGMGRGRLSQDQPRPHHRPRGDRDVHRRAAAALPGQGPRL